MKSLETVAKGAGLVFFGMIISKLLGYLYRLIIARIGTQEYGLLSIGFAVIGIVVVLALLGLDAGVVRYVAYFKGKNDKARIKGVIVDALRISLPLSILFGIVMYLSADYMANSIFHNAELSFIIKIFSFTIPFYTLSRVALAALKGFQRIEYEIYSRSIFENLARIILTLLVLYLGYSLFGAATAYMVSIVLMSFLAFYYLERKVFPFLKDHFKTIYSSKELISYSWPLMFSSLLYLVIVWTDILMIGYFKDVANVGIYNAALPTADLMLVVPVALISLFTPVITELFAKKKNEDINRVYKTTTKWIFFINLPIFLIMIFFSKAILNILFGSDYVSGASSLMVLASGYLIGVMFNTSEGILNMIKKSRLILFNAAIAAVVNIILNYILIPRYGIVGGAFATGVAIILYGILCGAEAYYLTKMQPLKLSYLKGIIAGGISILAVVYFVKLLFKGMPLILFIGVFLVFISLYLGLLILFKSFEEDDKSILDAIEEKGFKVGFLRKIIK